MELTVEDWNCVDFNFTPFTAVIEKGKSPRFPCGIFILCLEALLFSSFIVVGFVFLLFLPYLPNILIDETFNRTSNFTALETINNATNSHFTQFTNVTEVTETRHEDSPWYWWWQLA